MRLLKHGMTGDDVAEWQRVLINSGYDLSPWGDDGHFGDATHNATMSWQRERGLVGDGVVGTKTLEKVGITDAHYDDVDDDLKIDFKQAKNYTVANRKNPEDVRWVVLHSMEAGESSTTAENVAGWFASRSAPRASAHYNIDDDSIVQSVKEKDIAWHAGGANRYGIGLEHAGYARQTRAQWLDAFSKRMLERSARLTARICRRWNIPPVYVGRDDLIQGKRGITYHKEISKAFKKSDHHDPGEHFPMDLYLEWVQEEMKKLEEKGE